MKERIVFSKVVSWKNLLQNYSELFFMTARNTPSVCRDAVTAVPSSEIRLLYYLELLHIREDSFLKFLS